LRFLFFCGVLPLPSSSRGSEVHHHVNARWPQGTKRKTSAVRRAGDAAAAGGKEGSSDGAGANPFRNTLGIQFE
jgi:hypothetical protein